MLCYWIKFEWFYVDVVCGRGCLKGFFFYLIVFFGCLKCGCKVFVNWLVVFGWDFFFLYIVSSIVG